MINRRAILKMAFPLLTLFSQATSAYSSDAIGHLTVDSMTQGQLIWLKGRVGEGVYTFTDPRSRVCSIKVPVAIGSVSDSSLGFSQTNGLSIAVISDQLNKALLSGERINSQDWHFSMRHGEVNADALIVYGISDKEGFALNSKRKWISWFTNEKQGVDCK